MAMSYEYWTEYLKSARNGHDRPIDGSATKRVSYGYNGSVILRLHYTDVVTLHADGTETINTGGWHTVTTMRFIAEYSRARVWRDNGRLFVRTDHPTFTPPHVSKCRRCKGGQCPQSCYGPGWCYAGSDSGYGGRNGACEHGETFNHRRPQCEHGQTAAHALPPVDCWQCNGAGRFDYGSNPVHYEWNGEPLTIDCHGYPVGPVAETVSASKSKSYSDSGQLLRLALPALATTVKCPHCANNDRIDSIVIHLNDTAKWTRENVADWLDALDVDLSFPVPDHIPAHVA